MSSLAEQRNGALFEALMCALDTGRSNRTKVRKLLDLKPSSDERCCLNFDCCIAADCLKVYGIGSGTRFQFYFHTIKKFLRISIIKKYTITKRKCQEFSSIAPSSLCRILDAKCQLPPPLAQILNAPLKETAARDGRNVNSFAGFRDIFFELSFALKPQGHNLIIIDFPERKTGYVFKWIFCFEHIAF